MFVDPVLTLPASALSLFEACYALFNASLWKFQGVDATDLQRKRWSAYGESPC